MKENEEIRQTNTERKAWAQNEGNKLIQKGIEEQLKRPDFKNVYDEKVTVNEEEDIKTLFSKLKLHSHEAKLNSDPGAVTVYATFDVKCDREEIIDGSIKAILYNSTGVVAGYAYLYLPASGTADKWSVTMDGMCAEPKKFGPYTVKFEPINLWKVKKHKKILNGKNSVMLTEFLLYRFGMPGTPSLTVH